nr:uncharacterized protein LOC127310425 [Lolium perenne]
MDEDATTQFQNHQYSRGDYKKYPILIESDTDGGNAYGGVTGEYTPGVDYAALNNQFMNTDFSLGSSSDSNYQPTGRPYVPDSVMRTTHLPSASANLQVVEHTAPLQAEVGQEYLDNLTSRGRKNKAPASEAGPSEDPRAKRSKKGDGGKKGTAKHYRKRILVASGPALSLTRSAPRMRPEVSKDAPRASPPHQASPVPSGAEAEDTGASNIGAGTDEAKRVEPLVPPVPKKKKKKAIASPSKTVPETSAPAASPPAKVTPEAPAPSEEAASTPPAAHIGKPAPPEGAKLTAQQLAAAVTAAASPSSGSQAIVLHAGRAAVAAGDKASAQLGRITELNRGEVNLGHLLEYAEKWNQADMSPATRGLGMDKLPVVDPSDPRSTTQHLSRLRHAGTLDTRKQLFEELLWEHRFLAEAHSKCQAFPEASFESLSAQLSTLKAEKEQLVSEHRKALDAQEVITAGLKD